MSSIDRDFWTRILHFLDQQFSEFLTTVSEPDSRSNARIKIRTFQDKNQNHFSTVSNLELEQLSFVFLCSAIGWSSQSVGHLFVYAAYLVTLALYHSTGDAVCTGDIVHCASTVKWQWAFCFYWVKWTYCDCYTSNYRLQAFLKRIWIWYPEVTHSHLQCRDSACQYTALSQTRHRSTHVTQKYKLQHLAIVWFPYRDCCVILIISASQLTCWPN